MATLAEDLRVAAGDRLRDLAALLDGLSGRLAATSETARRALAIFEMYRRLIEDRIASDWEQFVDEDTRRNLLRFYLLDIGARLEEIEEWFAGGTDASVPPSLVDAVSAECDVVLETNRHVVLAIGEPDNMATLVEELPRLIFKSTEHLLQDLGVELPEDRFALIQISRFEASNPIWRPLIVGHEVGHLILLDKDTVDDFMIVNHLDQAQIGGLTTFPDDQPHLANFPHLAVETAAEDWLEELLCDAFALRRWGPAAIAALGTYLEQAGAMNSYGVHPPGS